jgi:tetratricopeptide (TPR) repeat protein
VGKASRKKSRDADSTVPDRTPRPVSISVPDRSPRALAIAAGLALLVIAVFGQVVTHDFINYDDPDYISANPTVQAGLTADGIRYAFTSVKPYYWQPLTWLSLELFGARSGIQLAVNVLLHAAAVVLLFLFLSETTGAIWLSAFAAAIWGVHPLRVESVAWVAERKDVLSTLLFIATIYAYARGRRAWTYVLFVLALMAKPMVVTLPVVLLLVDIWPLKRKPTIKDKVPLAALAIIVTAVTFIGQRGAIAQSVPLATRLSNAIVSYAAYLGKLLVPVNLAAIYPYPYTVDAWKVVVSAVALLGITAAVLYWKRPHLTAGWLWYLVTLVPVIGIVQAGPQSMADRFVYIPSIGIVTAAVWSIRVVALGVAAIAIFAALSVYNGRFWRDSITLFSHAVAVTKDNPLARVKLGDAYMAAGKTTEASEQYAQSVTLSRGGAIPLAAAGAALVQQKKYPEAIETLRRAVAFDPNIGAARENYGAALTSSGRPAEAVAQFVAALRLDNGSRRSEILHGLGNAKRLSGRTDDGIADINESIELKPTAAAWSDLGSAYSSKDDATRADVAFKQAIRLDPNLYDARMNYAALLSRTGQNDEAASQIREAMRLDPKAIEPRVYLAIVYAASGKNAEAAAIASEAQQMDGKTANELFTRALHLPAKETNLGDFIAEMGRGR